LVDTKAFGEDDLGHGDLVLIYDTTLRDGTQGEGVSLTVEDKLKITKKLDELGISYVEGGWPGSNPKDLEYFQAVKRLSLHRARIAAFGATRKAGLPVGEDANIRALLAADTPVVTIVGKTWDFHVVEALETTLDENLRMISDSVCYLKERGREVIYDAEHFFDGYQANPAYALATLQAAVEAGADWIVLCDTNGGTMPDKLAAACQLVRKRISVPLGIHAHNDCELAVANTLAAVRCGIRQVQGTVNGFGERCGNTNIISVIPNLQLKMGLQCLEEGKLAHLTEVSRYISEIANMTLQNSQPFVGTSAFAHKGGIHVNAVLKHPHTYEHIAPESVGNRRRVLVSELAGSSNLLYKAEEFKIDLTPNSSQTREVTSQIKELEYQGYQFEGAEASLELLMRRACGEYHEYFTLESLKILVEKRPIEGDGNGINSEATIKLRVGDQWIHTAAEGDGPVNAVDNALRKALEGFYPFLGEMHLVDYKVRVLDGKDGTTAKVRVLIESADASNSWSTVGVSTNIIEASWQALTDSMNYALLRNLQAEKTTD
jgi:2-isopropylmalate synthase